MKHILALILTAILSSFAHADYTVISDDRSVIDVIHSQGLVRTNNYAAAHVTRVTNGMILKQIVVVSGCAKNAGTFNITNVSEQFFWSSNGISQRDAVGYAICHLNLQ